MNDPLAFLDEFDNDSESDSLSFLDNKKEVPGGKLGRHAAQFLVGRAENIALPYDIAETTQTKKKSALEYKKELGKTLQMLATQKAFGTWTAEDEAFYEDIKEQLKNPEYAKKYESPQGFSSGKLIEKGAEKLGYDLETEDLGEEGSRFLGNKVNPKALLKGGKFAISMLKKEARQAHKLKSQWKALDVAAKKDPFKNNLLSFAKDNGLNPEEATLLLQLEGKVDVLGKIAKKTKKYEKTVESLKEKLGNNYEKFKTLGREGGYVSIAERQDVANKLYEVLDDITRTSSESVDTTKAREIIENTIGNLEKYGQSVEHFINARQEIRKGINWNNVTSGGVYREKANDAFLKAIERSNPKIAENIKNTDFGYSQYAKHRDILDKKNAIFKIKGFEIPSSSIAFGLAAKYTLGGKFGAISFAAKELSQRIATKLLVDPKYQAIGKRLRNAVVKGSTENQKEILVVLNKMLEKDDPEIFDVQEE